MKYPHSLSSAARRPVIATGRGPFQALRPLALVLASTLVFSGCLVLHPPCDLGDELYYRTLAVSSMETEEEASSAGFLPLSTEPPLLVDADSPPPMRDMTLDEAVRVGLENSKVLRDLGGNVLRRPDLAQTIHDPAIQATDPRFGMEGALSAFDAQFATRLMAYKNDRAFNNLFAGGGTFFFKQDLENYVSEVTKTTATGAAFALRQHIDYDANNAPANFFPSYYNVNFEGEFRQPLLQGGGVQFNRIAGPGATPGLVNGVVIARINNDVSTAEFEIGLRDLISNLENGYWDLYYAYRDLDSKISARDTSLNTWRIIRANVEQGRGYSKLQEVQALEQYYRFQEEVIEAMSGRNVDRTRTFNGSGGGTFRPVPGVQAAERRLRLWMGLPINDGRLIRPTDAPPDARIVFDWCAVMEEALAMRPDLRRQQAKVKRYQAELIANRNFLLPQLDIIGRYRWRGYGHDLIGPRDSAMPYNNAFANLTSGQFQEWELGFEYSMPLGFRQGYAAVRNSQVRIARERAVLEEQERQAVHDLSAAFADTDRAYAMMQVAYNRLAAAQDQYERAYNAFFNLGGKVSLELVLDARIRLAEAETSFHRAHIEYAVAIKNVHFEKGTLLEYNGAMLASDARCEGEPNQITHKHNNAPFNYVMANPPLAEGEVEGGQLLVPEAPHIEPSGPRTTVPPEQGAAEPARAQLRLAPQVPTAAPPAGINPVSFEGPMGQDGGRAALASPAEYVTGAQGSAASEPRGLTPAAPGLPQELGDVAAASRAIRLPSVKLAPDEAATATAADAVRSETAAEPAGGERPPSATQVADEAVTISDG